MSSSVDSRIFGRLGSVSLSDLVQLLGTSRRTATLVLERQGESAALFFRDGRVLHAQAGSIEGEDALPKLLDWVDATFVVEEGIANIPKITISKDTEALMLTSFFKIDLARRQSPQGNVRLGSGATTRAGYGNGKARGYPRPKRLPSSRRSNVLGYTAATVAAVGLIAFLVYFFVLGEFAAASFEPWSDLPPVQAPATPSLGIETLPLASLMAPSVIEEFLSATPPHHEGTERTASPVGRGARPDMQFRAAEGRPPSSERTIRGDGSSSQPVGFGFLLVIVQPWAEVVIDGRVQGETPLGNIQLSAGEHTVTLSNRDFAGVITDRVTISPNTTVIRKYSFDDFGYLQIVVRPWADVFIDGRPAGQTPIGKLKVPTGRHSVLLRHPELAEKTITTV
ncbi:MAG: DUF4388 domain-containing protein, partial [Vicinamibacteria bacterium]